MSSGQSFKHVYKWQCLFKLRQTWLCCWGCVTHSALNKIWWLTGLKHVTICDKSQYLASMNQVIHYSAVEGEWPTLSLTRSGGIPEWNTFCLCQSQYLASMNLRQAWQFCWGWVTHSALNCRSGGTPDWNAVSVYVSLNTHHQWIKTDTTMLLRVSDTLWSYIVSIRVKSKCLASLNPEIWLCCWAWETHSAPNHTVFPEKNAALK